VIRGRLTAPMVFVLVAIAGPATAQDTGPALAPHRFVLSAGATASGGYPVGDRTADLRRNATGSPAPVPLFRTESAFDWAPGFDARVDFAITRSLAVEVGATYATPRLGVTVLDDDESDPSVQLSEEVSQYSVDVSGLWHLPWPSLGRARPYVIGGGGYLRQLHQDRLVAETGQQIHAGAGLWLWFSGASASPRSTGVRAEVRLVRRFGGIEFEDASRNYPTVAVLGFLGL
jgi:hypothetical protein